MKPLLYHGDCMAWLPRFPEHSTDLILSDTPFGMIGQRMPKNGNGERRVTTRRDTGLDWPKLWPMLYRVLKPGGAIVLFAQQPFTTQLIASNPKGLKDVWYWVREQAPNFMLSKYGPLRLVQEICVFRNGTVPRYFPQLVKRDKPAKSNWAVMQSSVYDVALAQGKVLRTHRHPVNVLCYPNDRPRLLPFQKPVALLEYLLKTYSQAGDTVLDFTMGTGSTGVACRNLGRRFIGIERERAIALLARERILTGKVSPETLKAANGLDS